MQSSSQSLWPEDVSPTRFVSVGLVLEFIGNGVLYPFYFCKTHLATNVHHSGHGNPFIHLVKQAEYIVAENGWRGLYRGYLWSTMGSFPGIIMHIGAYTTAKHYLGYVEPVPVATANTHATLAGKSVVPQPLIPLVSGLVAESVAVLAYVPQEVVAQRLQLAPKGVMLSHVLNDVWRENGLRSFYRGTLATYAEYLPGSAIWWGSYEVFKNIICREKSRQNFACYSIAGIGGGLTTAVLTNPVDVIRTRIQTQKGTYGSSKLLTVAANIYW
eukprot:CAMPEP_0202701692 /NCGR_PEP_ID=MMETSP1385-20130828/14764_1 /ASSEMBLY_ACC=CAM_ASM_000861 /TAXON_ID=933848 /ORGANISM="Elphidium margaritaceum" /LENGTH=270 /DNA_ID=CAMNT_0049359169 /DNA_START=123 /DNA_END=932 /DNA_ORIENTATION=+